jgi:hypothetical protein
MFCRSDAETIILIELASVATIPVDAVETLRYAFCQEFNIFALQHDVLTLPACTCSLEVSATTFSFVVTAPTLFTFNPLLTADLTDVLQQTMESISPSNLALLDISETDLEFVLKQILLAEKHTTLT